MGLNQRVMRYGILRQIELNFSKPIYIKKSIIKTHVSLSDTWVIFLFVKRESNEKKLFVVLAAMVLSAVMACRNGGSGMT